MSDLINRQQAIDALRKLSQADGYITLPHEYVTDAIRGLPSAQPEPEEFEWCTDCKEYDQTAHCCHKWTKVIRQTVEEIKAEQKWIPVSERLPEEDVKVLVTDDAGGMTDIDVDSCGKYDDTGERFWYTSQNVTAWMPLPEAWKDGE